MLLVHTRWGRSLGLRSKTTRRAATLIELLVATAITLLLVRTVTVVFGNLSDRVSAVRSNAEMTSALRGVRQRLQLDLRGMTVRSAPPIRPEEDQGYLEIKEGPVGPILATQAIGFEDADEDQVFTSGVDLADSTIGDVDDVLQLTTRNQGAPFFGRYRNLVTGVQSTIQSEVAEVSWFVRGNKLFRRVLLVSPTSALPDPANNAFYVGGDGGYYADYDVSARQVGGPFDFKNPINPTDTRLLANGLADLTRRENRYGHQPWAWPHDTRFWGDLALPTLRESAHPDWPFPSHNGNLNPTGTTFDVSPANFSDLGVTPMFLIFPTDVQTFVNVRPRDLWNDPYPWTEDGTTATPNIVDRANGTLRNYANGVRVDEDAILGNVIGFDVKVWDPGAPIFAEPLASNPVNSVAPGDDLYLRLLQRFITDAFNNAASPNTDFQPVSFGAYVDLNYMCLTGFDPDQLVDSSNNPVASYEVALRNYEAAQGLALGSLPRPDFAGAGLAKSGLRGQNPVTVAPADPIAAIYDTGNFDYERDGLNQDLDTEVAGDGSDVIDPITGQPKALIDEGSDGQDNWIPLSGGGAVRVNGPDDITELEAPPPYPSSLRGVKVTVRVMDPGTRQIRQVTIVQDMLF